MRIALSPERKIIMELEVWEVTLLHQVTTRYGPNPWTDLYTPALQQAHANGVWQLTPAKDTP